MLELLREERASANNFRWWNPTVRWGRGATGEARVSQLSAVTVMMLPFKFVASISDSVDVRFGVGARVVDSDVFPRDPSEDESGCPR